MASLRKPHNETSSKFEERFSDMANSAYAMLGMTLGSRLGLFRKMAIRDEPWTPRELAEAGHWKERYVLEWLGVMVCADIVEVVPTADEDRYLLPHHRREFLTGPAPKMHEILPLVTVVYEDIVACFSINGPKGVPYSKYNHFHEFLAEQAENTFNWDFIQHFNGGTPGLTEKLVSGGRFLSIGCSSGVVDCIYAAKYPKSSFIGTDISEYAIGQAKEKAKSQNLSNLEFFVQDVYKMPDEWTETFDGIIGFDFLHDLPHPGEAAKELWRVLKVGGILAITDIYGHSRIADNAALPSSPVFYTASLFHCMPVSLHAGGIGAGTLWGRGNIIACLKSAGFNEVLEPQRKIQAYAHYACIKK